MTASGTFAIHSEGRRLSDVPLGSVFPVTGGSRCRALVEVTEWQTVE